MRILFAEAEYPYMHGSFLETAVRAAASAGIEVHVWSSDANSSFPHPLVATLHSNEPISACIDRVKPDIVHTHYLDLASRLAPEVASRGVPYTVRLHGCEYQPELLNRMAADAAFARIFIFPHYAEDVEPANRAKVAILPTMYNPEFYGPGQDRQLDADPKLVLRAVAGSNRKNIPYFLEAAALCPGYRFVLVMGDAYRFNRPPIDEMIALNARMGNPAEIRVNLDWPAMADLMCRAAIYMYTPPNHPAGMSISVAEAMACGCMVLAPDIRGMRAYLGDSGGRAYQTPAEAAEIVRSTASWGAGEWLALSRRASDYAARHYSMSMVAPALVAEWRRVLEERVQARFPVRAWWRRLGGRARAAA